MPIKTQKQEQPLKLDLYDKKILLSLMQDSRLPKTTLSKQLGISIQRLEYKLKRLYDNLIHPAIILNYSSLGIQEYFIFAESLQQETLDNLKNSPNIFFLAEFVGKYKYLIYTLTDNISKFKQESLPEENVETYKVTDFQTDTYNPFNLETKHKKDNLYFWWNLRNRTKHRRKRYKRKPDYYKAGGSTPNLKQWVYRCCQYYK